jgi:hypothetical protein
MLMFFLSILIKLLRVVTREQCTGCVNQRSSDIFFVPRKVMISSWGMILPEQEQLSRKILNQFLAQFFQTQSGGNFFLRNVLLQFVSMVNFIMKMLLYEVENRNLTTQVNII